MPFSHLLWATMRSRGHTPPGITGCGMEHHPTPHGLLHPRQSSEKGRRCEQSSAKPSEAHRVGERDPLESGDNAELYLSPVILENSEG